jgi:hypothetical protein
VDKVNKIVDKKDALFSASEDAIVKNAEELQKSIYEIIADELNKFENEDGKFKRTKANYDRINALTNKLKKEAGKTDLTKYLKDFDEIEKLNTELHSTLSDVDIDVKKLNTFKQELINATADNLIGAGMDANFVAPVKATLFKNITLGSPISELSKELKSYILGDKDKQGQLVRYSGQIARDAVSQYDGAINSMVLQEFDMNAIIYVGSVIKDSRPQCVRWANMDFIPVENLAKEIEKYNVKGNGMIPNTTPANFCANRGGYNCRHQAIPVYKEVLKKDK